MTVTITVNNENYEIYSGSNIFNPSDPNYAKFYACPEGDPNTYVHKDGNLYERAGAGGWFDHVEDIIEALENQKIVSDDEYLAACRIVELYESRARRCLK